MTVRITPIWCVDHNSWYCGCGPSEKTNDPPGYHLAKIKRGTLGEISKIREELEELEDAAAQGVKIMELVELSDLLGAVEAYLEKRHPSTTMFDLMNMKDVTKRAFKSGRRK